MSVYLKLDDWIRDYLPDLQILHEEPLSRHCSFRIGGPARRLALPGTPEQLVLLLNEARELGIRTLIIGNGSNMLFSDQGFEGLIISTRELCSVEVIPDGMLMAQSGASLARIATAAQQNGLEGLAFAHGIPGSLGGGIFMNAGAYGGELKDVIRQVTVLFPEEGIRNLSCEEMDFSYRHSMLSEHPDAVVLSAVFALRSGDPAAIRRQMDELMAKRKASQPLELPSAGSTFKRPAGYYAGALIEQAQCKGLSVGDAQVSPKHAGFVVNNGSASAADVLQLIREVQKKVFENSGVLLEPEVRIIEAS